MKNKIVNSLFIITFFNVLDRALAFVFKIYISRVVGAEGMGIYQIAFTFFSTMLTIVIGGIPLVVSKFVTRSKGKVEEKKIVGSALLLSFCISIGLILLFFALIVPLKIIVGKTTIVLVIFMLPTLIFSSAYCSLRGYLWGKEKFFAVSIVEVIEQVSRIGICVALLLLGFDKLSSVALSLSIGSLISCIACFIFFFCYKGKLSVCKQEILRINKSSFPITISNVVGALEASITAIIIPKLLIFSGYSQSQATALLGACLGMAMPLVFIPITLVSSLAFVLIPHISNCVKNNDLNKINNSINGAIKFACIVSGAIIPFLYCCGNLLCVFIYKNEESGEFLSFIAFALLPLTIENITGSILNSLDMEMKNFVNGLWGYSALWIVAIVCIGNYSIYALAIGFALSWTLSAILNIRCIMKKTGLKTSFIVDIIKTLIFCAPTILLCKNLLGITSNLHPFFTLTVCSICSVIFFGALSIIFGSISIVKLRFSRKKRILVNND